MKVFVIIERDRIPIKLVSTKSEAEQACSKSANLSYEELSFEPVPSCDGCLHHNAMNYESSLTCFKCSRFHEYSDHYQAKELIHE